MMLARAPGAAGATTIAKRTLRRIDPGTVACRLVSIRERGSDGWRAAGGAGETTDDGIGGARQGAFMSTTQVIAESTDGGRKS